MAINSYGYDGTVSEARWAEIGYGMGYGAAPSVVVSGLAVTVGGGTRALSISSGDAVACNVLTKNTSAVTVNAPANSSGSTRRLYVIAKFDWAANTTTFETKGSGTSLPALTQTPGTTWEMPLAWFTLPNGATTISAANINVCKPTPRFANFTVKVPAAVPNIFATSAGYTLDTVDLADPGWSYRVRVTGRVEVRSNGATTTGGFARLYATANGTQFGQGRSSPFTSGLVETLGVPIELVDFSPVQTGACTVGLVTAPEGLPQPGSYEVFGPSRKFVVEQIPV